MITLLYVPAPGEGEVSVSTWDKAEENIAENIFTAWSGYNFDPGDRVLWIEDGKVQREHISP